MHTVSYFSKLWHFFVKMSHLSFIRWCDCFWISLLVLTTCYGRQILESKAEEVELGLMTQGVIKCSGQLSTICSVLGTRSCDQPLVCQFYHGTRIKWITHSSHTSNQIGIIHRALNTHWVIYSSKIQKVLAMSEHPWQNLSQSWTGASSNNSIC